MTIDIADSSCAKLLVAVSIDFTVFSRINLAVSAEGKKNGLVALACFLRSGLAAFLSGHALKIIFALFSWFKLAIAADRKDRS